MSADTYLLCSTQEKLIGVTCNSTSLGGGRAVSCTARVFGPPLCSAEEVGCDQMAVPKAVYKGPCDTRTLSGV